MRPLRLLAIASALLLPAALSAQKAPPTDSSSTERELVRLENEWARALVRRDTATFRRILSPRFVYTENAELSGADDVIRGVTGPERVEWAGNEGMTVHDFGNTGVVTGILAVRGTTGRRKFSRRYRFTDTWQRADGRWRIIAAQDYVMPK